MPKDTVAIPFESFESIDMRFMHVVSLKRSDELLKQMKNTGSIQVQLFKADPSVEASDFDWDFTTNSDFSLKLTVNFTDPDTISSSAMGEDILRVVFKDASNFISCPLIKQSDGRRLSAMPKGVEVKTRLPSLFKTSATEGFDRALAVLDNAAGKGSIVSSVVVNYIIGMSINLLWGGINSL